MSLGGAIGGAITNVANSATDQAGNAEQTVTKVADQVADAVVGAATQGGDAAATNTDTVGADLVDIAVWIVATATSLADDAVNMTLAAADAQTHSKASCARTWAMVGAIIAVVVAIVVAVVVSVFTFGAGTSAVIAVVSASAAVIDAAITAAMGSAAAIQMAIATSLRAVVVLVNPVTTSAQRDRTRRDVVNNLKYAMTLVQAAAAQRLPATSVDLSRSLATAAQMTQATQKLSVVLRQRQSSPRVALLASRLAQLGQSHGALLGAVRLKISVSPPVVGPPTGPSPISLTINTGAIR